MIKLLIFDLDGTLIDSAADVVTTTNDLLVSNGLPALPHARIVSAIGRGIRELLIDIFPSSLSSPDQIDALEKAYVTLYERNCLLTTRVYPGADEFLGSCDRRISIVTNKREKIARKVVSSLSIGRYDWLTIFGADSLALRKPDPLPLVETMRLAGVAPHETLMIGDGIPDIIAAQRAGIHSIAIEFGYTEPSKLIEHGASLTLRSYAELPQILHLAESLPPKKSK